MWKPKQKIHTIQNNSNVYKINNATNQSILYEIDLDQFAVQSSSNNNRVFMEWAFFGESQYGYNLEFSDYFQSFQFFWYWKSSFPENQERIQDDHQPFGESVHTNITLPANNGVGFIYWRAEIVEDESPINVQTALISEGDRHQVSSIPIVWPHLGLEIAPAIMYVLCISVGIGFACCCCLPSKMQRANFMFGFFKKQEKFFFIISGILFALTLLFIGLSFAPDCVSYIYCCSYGGYGALASDHFVYFHHYEDRPLNQDQSWPINGYRPRNYSSDSNKMAVDCIAKPNSLGQKDDAESVCVQGDVYHTCANGVGAFPFLVFALHAVSLIPLILATASCYSRCKVQKEKEKERQNDDNDHL
eukprot:gb/GECH01007375.1/.p1 GENE.gb/GECH01007375.1/~~gb/GECH01007375.1/.p1  ORF type:complete len:360 (+),score=71.39 gb/GECH01007375.1/:1-1080(+)